MNNSVIRQSIAKFIQHGIREHTKVSELGDNLRNSVMRSLSMSIKKSLVSYREETSRAILAKREKLLNEKIGKTVFKFSNDNKDPSA